MDRSIGTGTLRSLTNANKSVGGGNTRTLRQQRTATSNRTGGVSSSAQTSVHYKAVERHRPKVYILFRSRFKKPPIYFTVLYIY